MSGPFIVEATGFQAEPFETLAGALDYVETIRPVLLADARLGVFEPAHPAVIGVGGEPDRYCVVLSDAVKAGKPVTGVGPRWTRQELVDAWPLGVDLEPCPDCYGRLWALMPDEYQCEDCLEWFEDEPYVPMQALPARRRNRAVT